MYPTFWPPPAHAGPRLAARVGPRPTVAVRLRESVRCSSPSNGLLFWGFLFLFRDRVFRCLGVCVCWVCIGAFAAPFVLVRCWCSCGGPASPCAGVGPVGAFWSGFESWRRFFFWVFGDLARHTRGVSEGRSIRDSSEVPKWPSKYGSPDSSSLSSLRKSTSFLSVSRAI